MTVCKNGWEALRGDPLPWLLDEDRPNLHWRVLTELVGRPADSPAVRRARTGANSCEPLASLLADLHPDGSWACRARQWTAYSGTGWRLVAAMQWGADPDDPRLQAAAGKLLETTAGEGGLAYQAGEPPSVLITARAIQALATLGWCRHSRFQECLAWLEEGADAGIWLRLGQAVSAPRQRRDAAAAVAVLSAFASCEGSKRRRLRSWAADYLLAVLDAEQGAGRQLGFPNLQRTDVGEILQALRRIEWPFERRMLSALGCLQELQQEDGRWTAAVAPTASLPIAEQYQSSQGAQSCWITLRAVAVLLYYAVEASLPRLFPQRPT